MRITFICAVFPPEPAPSGVMAHQLVSRLVRDGHDVTMVVPIPNRPAGAIYSGHRRQLLSRTVTDEGYTLIRCANWLIGKQRRNVNRILENITFGMSSAWAVWREPCPDVIIVETWPLFASSAIAFIARLWSVPYLYYIKDVYPEAAEDAGIIRPAGTVSRICRSWDRFLCTHSARVIVISETMRDLVSRNRQMARGCFTVIPDWIDESAFPVWRGESRWRNSQGIPTDRFIALFAGTLGRASGVEILVEVAAALRLEEKILLLCIGEGVEKQSMQDEALRQGLQNILFLPFQPSALVPEFQACCEVALLTMRPNASDSSVPSKLISYFATSRPVICSANQKSAVARAVLEASAGLIVPPGDALAIAQAIMELEREPERVRQMGRNARRYYEEHFTLDRAYPQFLELLGNTVTSKTCSSL